MDIVKNNIISQFQVVYMYFPYLKHNKASKDQEEKSLAQCLQKTVIAIKNVKER